VNVLDAEANKPQAPLCGINLSAIQGFIKRGLAEYKNPLQLILTGGDADFLADKLKLETTIDAPLTIDDIQS
jgi:pantothenate kinase type III